VKVKLWLIIATVLWLAGAVFVTLWLTQPEILVLHPHGPIADQQRDLILFTSVLGAGIVLPVFVMLFAIAWRYRASNKKATYTPDWDHHRGIEALWWGIPCVVIVILGVITWGATHALDPYRSIDSSVTPLKIQVVALQWKWLFIYPDQHVATVNQLQLPVNTPIDFEITADAPMNSFWIPSLGGQVYAMSGMSTQLHLMAHDTGSYPGSSANISGKGFADMHFMATVTSRQDFDKWARPASSSLMLDKKVYDNSLAQPNTMQPSVYMLHDSNLYNEIIMKYMSPDGQNSDDSMSGMDMQMGGQ